MVNMHGKTFPVFMEREYLKLMPSVVNHSYKHKLPQAGNLDVTRQK